MADEQQIFAAAFAKAAINRGAQTARYEDVKSCGDLVMDALEAEFKTHRNEFNARMRVGELEREYHAHVYRPQPANRDWYFAQIVECARRLDYFADTRSYADWVRLTLAEESDERATVLVISLHSVGTTFKGILSGVAFIEIVSTTEGEQQRQGPILATEEPLTFGYLDPHGHVVSRSKEWAQAAWLSLLRVWQNNL